MSGICPNHGAFDAECCPVDGYIGTDEERARWDADAKNEQQRSDALVNELRQLLLNGSEPNLARVFALLAWSVMEQTIEQRQSNRLAVASIEQTAVLIQFLIDNEPGVEDDEPRTFLDGSPRRKAS